MAGFLLRVLIVALGLWLASELVPGIDVDFQIAGFGSALLGSMVVSITGWLASWLIGPRGRVEVIAARGRS